MTRLTLVLAALAACGPEVPALSLGDDSVGVVRTQITGSTPFAVLLCRFQDNLSDPGIPFATYQRLFTTAGSGTWNVPRYFSDASQGAVNLDGSNVFGWYTIPRNFSDYVPGSSPYAPLMEDCKHSAMAAGVPLASYWGAVAVFNVALGGPQGGGWGPTLPSPGVLSDYRYVTGGGTAVYGHEVGHAFGLMHSRRDGTTADYTDRWDIMSAMSDFYAPDPDYGARGAGMNAWNMRAAGWLDEGRTWKGSGDFDQVVQLTAVMRHDLPGYIAAELPPMVNGHGKYLVELRVKAGWDAGLPRSAVLVHRYEAPNSYLMAGRGGVYDLVAGDEFDADGARLEVLSIDEAAATARVRLSYAASTPTLVSLVPRLVGLSRPEVFGLGTDGKVWHLRQDAHGAWLPIWFVLGGAAGLREMVVGRQADGRLVVFAVDGNPGLWRIEQQASGEWGSWQPLWGATLNHLAVANQADGRLDVFGLQPNGSVVHVVQAAANSASWGGFVTLGAAAGLQQLAVGRNLDGRLQIAAIDANSGVWNVVQAAANSPAWSNWWPFWGAWLQRLSLANDLDGRLELLALARDGSIARLVQPYAGAGWSSFQTIGGRGGFVEMTVGRNADGRLDVFARDGNPGVWRMTQTAPNGGWGAFASFGPWRISALAAGTRVDGRQDLFGLDGTPTGSWHSWQTAPNGGFDSWSPTWLPPMRQVAPSLETGSGILVGVGSDGHVWKTYRSAGTWGGDWSVIGGAAGLKEVVAARQPDGRLYLFAVDGGPAVWMTSENAPGGGWNEWVPLWGPTLNHLVLARHGTGRLELFGLSPTGSVVNLPQAAPNGGFGSFVTVGGLTGLKELAVLPNDDDRLEVMAIDANPGVWHVAASAGGGWGTWTSTSGAALKKIALGRDAASKLVLFGVDVAGHLVTTTQTAPSTESWSAFVQIGDAVGLTDVAVGRNANGALQIYCFDGSNSQWSNRQTGGAWGPWVPSFNVGGGRLVSAVNPNLTLEFYGPNLTDSTVSFVAQLSPDGGYAPWLRIFER